MWQEILITDLTRMGNDTCIVGITRELKVIRPEMRYGGIPEKLLYQNNKVIVRPRAILNVKVEEKENLVPPHLEDYLWLDPEQTQVRQYLDEDKWQNYLHRTCSPSVQAIFEVDLYRNKTIEPGTGTRSVGTIKPKSIDNFIYKMINRDGKDRRDYRLSFTDLDNNYFDSIKVNDLALQNYVDYLHISQGLSRDDISEKLAESFNQSNVLLRLGLGREWESRCWLQVNGIYTFPDYLEGKCFADFRL